jgi:hypothetical protein
MIGYVTAKSGFKAQNNPYRNFMDKVTLAQVFLGIL